MLADSERTEDLMLAEEAWANAQLDYLLGSTLFDSEEGRALRADRPDLSDTDLDRLARLPDGTLGREFARFLADNELDYALSFRPPELVEGEEARWLMRRIRQSHDLWHVLLGYGTRGHEEVLVHVFSLTQTGLPVSLAIATLGAVKHMVLERRWSCLWSTCPELYRLGLRASPVLAAYWERQWEAPLEAVRERYGIRPVAVE